MFAETIVQEPSASHVLAKETAPPARPAVRSPGQRLRDALMELGEHQCRIVTHSERNWASITFAGTRHRLAIQFAGAEAVAAGEHFIAALPDHEFAIPRQLVAQAIIQEVEHRLLPSPRMVVLCEVLMLDYA